MREVEITTQHLIADGFDIGTARDPYKKFVPALSSNPPANNMAMLCGLYVGDCLAATIWGLTHNGRFYHLLPTYEKDELTKYSPGSILLLKLLEWCIAKQITVYDFTAGDESYKALWCDQNLQLHDYIEGVTVRGKIFAAREKTYRYLKRRIKKAPLLFSLAKRVRAG